MQHFNDFRPAELRICKSRWYIQFYVRNPKTEKLHRKIIKVNRVASLRERKKHARFLVVELNQKLYSGWNPFLEQEAPKAFVKLVDALNTFVAMKTKEKLRADSLRVYKSTTKTMTTYLTYVLKVANLPVISFSSTHAKNYLEYLFENKNIGNTTYNNYVTQSIVIWNWLKEHQYVKANVFEGTKRKKAAKKTRQIIDISTRTKIKQYLTEKGEFEYLTIAMLCYHGLMRPKEICMLQPSNIILDKQMIFLLPDQAKDLEERIISLSPEVVALLRKLNIDEIPKGHYIFSTGFRPGTKLIGSRETGKRWAKLRKEIGMKMEYQFYSLKDTGIVQKIKDGVNMLDIRDQAGHSSLEQTNAYAKYANIGGSVELRNKSSNF